MTVSERLESALAPLNMPVKRGVYKGKASIYAVYLFDGDMTEVYANGEPCLDTRSGTLHLYVHSGAKVSSRALARQARKALYSAGFFAQIGAESYEYDTDITHTVIDFDVLIASEGEELPE